MQRPAKVLVIRFSSIGDIVLTTPVVRALKTQLEGDTIIHYITKDSYAPIVESNPNVSKVFAIKEQVSEVADQLIEENYDYIIDLHKNIRSAQVKSQLKKVTFSFDKLNFKKFLLVSFGVDKLPDLHIVDRYLETLRGFGVEDDQQGLEFYIPPQDEVAMDSLPSGFQKAYSVWVIGAAHEGKKMTASKVKKIVDQMTTPVILVGGKDDQESGDLIAAGNDLIYNACGKYSVNQSASIIKNSQLVISGDTGMMHIASAFQKDIISLWGCTSPKFGMYPYRPGKDSVILEPTQLKKRPCSKLGNSCKYGMENKCIDQIGDEILLKEIEARL